MTSVPSTLMTSGQTTTQDISTSTLMTPVRSTLMTSGQTTTQDISTINPNDISTINPNDIRSNNYTRHQYDQP